MQPRSSSAPAGGDASINTCNGREPLTRPDGLVTLNCTASTAPSGCSGNARGELLVSDGSKLVSWTWGLDRAEEFGRWRGLGKVAGPWLPIMASWAAQVLHWGASFVQLVLVCANMAGDLAAHEDPARTVGGRQLETDRVAPLPEGTVLERHGRERLVQLRLPV